MATHTKMLLVGGRPMGTLLPSVPDTWVGSGGGHGAPFTALKSTGRKLLPRNRRAYLVESPIPKRHSCFIVKIHKFANVLRYSCRVEK